MNTPLKPAPKPAPEPARPFEPLTGEEVDVKVKLVISDSLLSDILSTAIEGGIQYWARVRSVVMAEGTEYDPVQARITESESSHDGGRIDKTINLHDLRDAAVRMLERRDPDGLPHERFSGNLCVAVVTNDASNLDVEDADCLVQIAVLGSIVYG